MIPPKLDSHKEMQSWTLKQRCLSLVWANKCEISDLLIIMLFYVTEWWIFISTKYLRWWDYDCHNIFKSIKMVT